jgi:hypothetical protein
MLCPAQMLGTPLAIIPRFAFAFAVAFVAAAFQAGALARMLGTISPVIFRLCLDGRVCLW